MGERSKPRFLSEDEAGHVGGIEQDAPLDPDGTEFPAIYEVIDCSDGHPKHLGYLFAGLKMGRG